MFIFLCSKYKKICKMLVFSPFQTDADQTLLQHCKIVSVLYSVQLPPDDN